jgi:hypothetical protein
MARHRTAGTHASIAGTLGGDNRRRPQRRRVRIES